MVKKQVKAAPKRNAEDVPKSPAAQWSTGFSTKLVNYNDSLSAKHALSNPIVYRIVSRLASAVSQVRWYAEIKKSGSGTPGSKPQEKAINDLLQFPNDQMNASQFKYWLALNLAVYHKAAFKVGTGINKVANGMYPLETEYLLIRPDARGGIDYYEYGISNAKENIKTRKKSDGNSWCHQIYVPSLSGSFSASGQCNSTYSPLNSIIGPEQVVRNLIDRALNNSSGATNLKYIVTAEARMTEKQSAAVKEHISGENEDDGQVLFLRNTKIDVHKLDSGLGDIHSKIPLDDMTRMISGAFGYPVPLLGLNAADGAKFAGNFAESRISLYEDTIIPHYLNPIAEGITEAICPDGIEVKFDLDSIPAISESRMKTALNLEMVNFLTINEKREIVGYQPTTEPLGKKDNTNANSN